MDHSATVNRGIQQTRVKVMEGSIRNTLKKPTRVDKGVVEVAKTTIGEGVKAASKEQVNGTVTPEKTVKVFGVDSGDPVKLSSDK